MTTGNGSILFRNSKGLPDRSNGKAEENACYYPASGDRILEKILWEESDFHVLCHLRHPHHPLAMITYDLTKPQVMKQRTT